MAISLNTTYPAKSGVPTAAYPQGVARNITVPSDGTGTPWEASWILDKEGFFQGLLDRSAIVPSGAPDTVLASDYHDALDVLYLAKLGTLRVNATVPVPGEGDRFPLEHQAGCLNTWVSGTNQRTEVGERRNFVNTHDMTLPAARDKTINATWVAGDAVGGLPDGLVIATGWYKRFLVMKPDGTTDICWDLDDAAANFFLDANAIAAGYSDATLYRRLRWDFWDGALVPESFNNGSRPSWNNWADIRTQISAGNVNTSPRQGFVCSGIPPECYGVMNWYVNADDSIRILITQLEETDAAAASSRFTWRGANNSDSSGVVGEWRVDINQTIYARKDLTSGNVDVFNMESPGWFDPGISA